MASTMETISAIKTLHHFPKAQLQIATYEAGGTLTNLIDWSRCY